MAAHGGTTTTDHNEIRRWAESRGAHPSRAARTGAGGRAVDPGVIRLDLPGYTGAGALEPITWDEWFQAFDDDGLAFIYQETAADGGPSNFNRLVKRETAEARERGDSPAPVTRPPRRGGGKGARTGVAKGAGKAAGAKTAAKTAGRAAGKSTSKGAATPGVKTAANGGATKVATARSAAKRPAGKRGAQGR